MSPSWIVQDNLPHKVLISNLHICEVSLAHIMGCIPRLQGSGHGHLCRPFFPPPLPLTLSLVQTVAMGERVVIRDWFDSFSEDSVGSVPGAWEKMARMSWEGDNIISGRVTWEGGGQQDSRWQVDIQE